VLGVNGERFSGLGVGQPCELHDRSARRVEDQTLDILCRTLDAAALASQDGDFRYRGHDVEIKDPQRAAPLSPGIADINRWLAPRVSIVSLWFLASARLCVGGNRARAGSSARTVSRGSEPTPLHRPAQCEISQGLVAGRCRCYRDMSGGVVAREVLLGRRSKAPPLQPDRAGPGRRHMSFQQSQRRLVCRGWARGQRGSTRHGQPPHCVALSHPEGEAVR
jgi:hypothetical protein